MSNSVIVLGALAVGGASAATAMAISGPGHASAARQPANASVVQPRFMAQARAAHLSGAQVSQLQREVNKFIQTNGGTQVAFNLLIIRAKAAERQGKGSDQPKATG